MLEPRSNNNGNNKSGLAPLVTATLHKSFLLIKKGDNWSLPNYCLLDSFMYHVRIKKVSINGKEKFYLVVMRPWFAKDLDLKNDHKPIYAKTTPDQVAFKIDNWLMINRNNIEAKNVSQDMKVFKDFFIEEAENGAMYPLICKNLSNGILPIIRIYEDSVVFCSCVNLFTLLTSDNLSPFSPSVKDFEDFKLIYPDTLSRDLLSHEYHGVWDKFVGSNEKSFSDPLILYQFPRCEGTTRNLISPDEIITRLAHYNGNHILKFLKEKYAGKMTMQQQADWKEMVEQNQIEKLIACLPIGAKNSLLVSKLY